MTKTTNPNKIESFLQKTDWRVNENSNNGDPTFSGLMLFLANTEISKYALENIYPEKISKAHIDGSIHIHDLGYAMIPYCSGWSLGKLIKEGINKIPGKASSAPAKHLNSLMIQMVNFLGCMQMEHAGAQAFNNVDTHLAPFIKVDNLSYEDVKQFMQQLVFNLNIPSRWGCVSEDTEILTMAGWKAYELLRVGEHIATYNIKKQKTEYYPVQKVNVYDFRGNLIHFRSDNVDALVTRNHRNVTRYIGKFDEEMVYTEQLLESPISFSFPYIIDTEDVKYDKIKFSKIGEKLLYKYNGKVWCPTVNNGTWIARRNGTMFITGNSQAPFTNFTFDIKCPADMYSQKAWVGGKEKNFTYGDCQKEMDMVNRAFMEIMEHGDSDGQIFTFPIPTYNIDKEFDWDSPITDKLMAMASKYGIPYFANYVSSDMNPEDVRSMCPMDENTPIVYRELGTKKKLQRRIVDIFKDEKLELIEVWTNDGWKKARPNKMPSTKAYELHFGNNISVIFGENHLQPVLDKGTIKVSEIKVEDWLPFSKHPFRDKEKGIYEYRKVTSIIEKDKYNKELYCFEVDSRDYLFMLGNGLITHNCRLRLSLSELRRRNGGFFGAGDQTGSLSVVTINLPRIGYLSKTKKELYKSLSDLMLIAKECSDLKRIECEESLNSGLLPYVKRYTDNGFDNHFSTIGLVGMNELLLNFIGQDIGSKEGNKLANEILDFMNLQLSKYQEESPNKVLYNLEATPAEGTSYRLAKIDKEHYPDIITANEEETPYYTNSVHLPVSYTDDIFEVLNLEDEMQVKFTSGTVIHLYLGQAIDNYETTKSLVKSIVNNFKLPYFSITPTFSTCIDHGYIKGEVSICPTCGKDTLIWSRVTGYIRPVQNYNKGKKQEYKDRVFYKVEDRS